MTVTETDSEAVVRRVPLSRIEPADGFNPRTSSDPERFDRLVASIQADGLLSPLLVTPIQDGGFRLIAGEGRWLACGEAQITEVPVHIVQVDDKTGGLELAMAENLARQDLDPVEEARGFQRLREAGLQADVPAPRLRRGAALNARSRERGRPAREPICVQRADPSHYALRVSARASSSPSR